MVIAWVATALIMAVVEVASVAFYALFLAIGALAAALAALFGLDVIPQALVFLVVSGLGVIGLRPILIRRRRPPVASGAAGMIGQAAVVTDSIGGGQERGHVHVAGEDWPALSADGGAIDAKSNVTVTEIRGATLVVRK